MTQTAIRRMLRPVRAVPNGARVPELRAWKQSLPRAAERTLGLIAAVTDVAEGTTDLVSLLEEWAPTSVHWLLRDGGLAVLDAEGLAALVEVQTTRRVGTAPILQRTPTAVDQALAAHAVSDWLAARDMAMSSAEGQVKLGRFVTSERVAKMALPDGEYHVRRIRIDFADGAREGRLTLAVPVPVEVVNDSRPPLEMSGLMSPRADLVAVLHRTQVPYRWLRDLRPGAILEIPRSSVQSMRIETTEGRVVGKARLGQISGHRAVKLLDADVDGVPEAADHGTLEPVGLPRMV